MPEKNAVGLYPCPWCGNKKVHPVTDVVPIYGDDERTVQGLHKMYYIHCGIWNCNRPYATFHATEKMAKDAWNFEAEMIANYKEEHNEN